MTITITRPVFFTQYQGERPDYSDGTAVEDALYNSVDDGLAAFNADHGHRRLLCLHVDAVSGKAVGLAMEIKRV